MPRPKREGGPGYEPTVQFRPPPTLAHLVRPFADRRGLALNEAYKDLAALAVVGLDVRYFDLVNQVALALGGANAFVQACLNIHSALKGAALKGQTLTLEPERSQFILKVVQDFVEDTGRQLAQLDLWFPREKADEKARAEEPAPSRKKSSAEKKKRTIRVDRDDDEAGQPGLDE